MTPTVAIEDHVKEALTAINADTLELESQISALESLIFGLVSVHGTSLEQLKSALRNAFEGDLDEPACDDRATLTEGDAVVRFLRNN